jgi:tRNA (uracil-5-)-methyltransferase
MAEPLCPYFGDCGGCIAQNVDYPAQLENKRKQLANAIGREEIEVFYGREYFYRTRVDMVFHPGGLGFRRKGVWHKVIDIGKCVIANEKINQLISEVRSFFTAVDAFDLRKKSGTFRYAVIRAPQEDSSISFVLNGNSTHLLEAREKIQEFARSCGAASVVVTYVPAITDVSVSEDYFVVKGTDRLRESYLGHTFQHHVQGFFQNNFHMAEKLHGYVREILRRYDTAGVHLLDLYGGVGTFGIINADLFREVTVVESFPQAIECAERNIAADGVGNVRAVALDASRLKNLKPAGPLYVITDPPRSGMHPKTIHELNLLHPGLIVYVSCNVKQLGADLPKLKGYAIRSAALFDLFPQTPHSEAVLELAPEG